MKLCTYLFVFLIYSKVIGVLGRQPFFFPNVGTKLFFKWVDNFLVHCSINLLLALMIDWSAVAALVITAPRQSMHFIDLFLEGILW